MEDSFLNKLKKLSLNNKIILVGSFLMLISAFMPWYSDVDRFNTGDMFLGVTGPVYLAGVLVVIGAAMSLGITVMHLLQKEVPKLPIKEKHFHMATAGIALLMTVMASSVYFHAKFGVNITSKTMGSGMMLAFVGIAITIGGTFVSEKKRMLDIDEEGHLDPLIHLDHTNERVQGTLENTEEDVHNAAPGPELYTGRNVSRGMVEEAITVGEAMRRAGQDDKDTNDIR